MKKTSIYVDTSVIGGCCDPEFQEWSNGLLSDFQAGKFLLFMSELTDSEIEDAPRAVREIYKIFRNYSKDILLLNPEAVELAAVYLRRGILTEKYQDDARHIAIATIAAVDLVVSWNFKHIVHFDKIQKFNAVNLEMGYKPIMIYSPREVTTYGS